MTTDHIRALESFAKMLDGFSINKQKMADEATQDDAFSKDYLEGQAVGLCVASLHLRKLIEQLKTR